jgi:hypothetical protein
MALSQDLMGLGENPFAAARMATGGTGPVTMAAAGNGSAAQAAQINGTQFVAFISTGTGAVQLPALGGIAGALIYDNFVVHNGTGATVSVYPPTGCTINIGGSNFTTAGGFALTTLRTVTLWSGPTASQWFGLSN